MAKILIVDDEEPIVQVVKDMLKPEGYEISEAYSGQECLDKLKKETPDLILLDFFMPGLSGREVLEKIRRDPKNKNIKVALMTAASFSAVGKKEFETLGIVDDIKKPFDQEDLKKRIKAILS